jgi:hypothetical protein
MLSEPRMDLELPGVGELVEDQPGAQIGAAEVEVAFDPGDVGLDEVERARLTGSPRDVLQREDRVVLAEDPARHQAEQLAHVAVEHAPAHAGRQ